MGSVSNIIAGALIGLGVASAGYMAGDALIKSRLGLRTVTVKGLSEREVKADLGFWPVRFVVTGPTLEDSARQARGLRSGGEGVPEVARLRRCRHGGPEYPGRRPHGRLQCARIPEDTRFVLTEDLLVRSIDVAKLADASRSVGDLLKSGVVFSSDAYNAGPSYIFTKIADLKGDMLTEATRRAREAAQKFAEESGAKVGDIQNANQGIFEIKPAVEIPNDRPEKQIDKMVRVVTTITYFLKQ